jgi:hypothetical protein
LVKLQSASLEHASSGVGRTAGAACADAVAEGAAATGDGDSGVDGGSGVDGAAPEGALSAATPPSAGELVACAGELAS